MLNPPSTSTRLVDLSEVYAARKRGLEALRQSIVITKNPFLIAMADGEIPPIVEFNTKKERPKRKKKASLKTE